LGTKIIGAFAFGTPKDNRSNRHLSRIISEEVGNNYGSVYTQQDIDVGNGIEVKYIPQEGSDKPPPTLRIGRGLVAYAKRKEAEEIIIVAAKPHLRRVLRDVKYAMREAKVNIPIRVSEGIERVPEGEWFDPQSTQKRTTSLKEWQGREKILMALPMFIYKRIAS
jgi:hypothetical protein